MIRTTQNFDIFDKKHAYYVNHFWYIAGAILKEVLHVKQIMMLRVIFHYSKNYDSLTLQTKFKVILNMGDLTFFVFLFFFSRQFVPLKDFINLLVWSLIENMIDILME